MSHAPIPPLTSTVGRPRPPAQFGPFRLTRPLALLALWHRRAHTRAQLSRIDAEALRDIGIGEAERRAECVLWFWQGGDD
ncbi:MAG: DUF1127 domain-containing protein [Rhodobacteraceae bacterium]|uniref:DUF1127 domain-containing protein n=1 Tax=Celeribacter sp. HF31 TaxID=2721558 RepID=UPI00142F948F|nr:DUF1127 domain-containing protein [Celeribacter sp. HF31]NVK47000.1 DUF1127 domain-containing protein [Paracoccaceae bacterium]